MNVKNILQTLEHVMLIAIVAGAIGFFVGNSYGSAHVDLKSLKTASVQSK